MRAPASPLLGKVKVEVGIEVSAIVLHVVVFYFTLQKYTFSLNPPTFLSTFLKIISILPEKPR